MLMFRSTHDAEVRRLDRQLDASYEENSRLSTTNGRLTDENGQLRATIRRLERRNRLALPLVKNAETGLAHVFGTVTEVDADSDDPRLVDYLAYRADSGLAHILLRPSDGQIVVSDPEQLVRRTVEVTLDIEGNLDEDEQEQIGDFLAAVSFARTHGVGRITGPVSLVAKPRPASTDAEQDAATV